MMGVDQGDSDDAEFVEFDPTRRYGRYNEILGKGASKIVYRAFDEYEGIEVAWNQVKLNDFLQSPEELERLYCEIHLLKTLKHKNIMKFYTSWVDISKRNINFVTELFTSGTLRQYRQRHKRVHIRAVKHWCRQILKGLLYLHSRDPPIIHRDLKCDNIFINGNQGVVKIGDLGLAAILRKSYADHCVGTPEFMAPEVYEEEYNELVDIYAFGMCLLEMVTSDYPYSECTHPAQIYLKVITGTKPEALSKVNDPEVRQFVEKCLVTASRRLSARELLMDPFLQCDDRGSGSWEKDIGEMCQILRQPSYVLGSNGSLITNGGWGCGDPETSHILRHPHHNLLHSDDGSMVSNGFDYDPPRETMGENGWDYNAPSFGEEDEPSDYVDITIKGTRGENGGIFLRLRIPDEEGHIQNIYFPFDIETDTALDVATEMVAELDIIDYDVDRISEMIDGEVCSLAPEWKPDPTIAFCGKSPSDVSIDTSAIHCQFEEMTYQVVGSDQKAVSNGAPAPSTSQAEVLDLSSHASRESHSDDEGDQFNPSVNTEKDICVDVNMQTGIREFVDQLHSNSIRHQSPKTMKSKFPCPSPRCPSPRISNDYKNKIRHQLEQKDHRNTKSGEIGDAAKETSEEFRNSFHFGKRFSFNIPPRRKLLQPSKSCKENPNSSNDNMFTAKSFYAGVHLPSSLPRTNSLPQSAAVGRDV